MADYINISDQSKTKILQNFKISTSDLEKLITTLRNWVLEQVHLPRQEIEDDLYIELFLLNNKFDVEKCKQKIDNYYTTKTYYNSYFQNLWEIVPSKASVFKIPLGQTAEFSRIVLMKLINLNPNDFNMFEIAKAQILNLELLFRIDYSISQIAIIDLEGISFEAVKNVKMQELIDYFKILKHCYSGRTSAIHFINIPGFLDFLIKYVRKTFSEKMEGRIKVHKNLDDLFKYVPRESFPTEYGGNGKSLKEYLDIWDKFVREKKDFLQKIPTIKSNESLRTVESPFKDLISATGHFKSLNID